MLRKILIYIVCLGISLVSLSSVNADFNKFTEIKENQKLTFPKVQGQNKTLKLYRDYQMNIFENDTIKYVTDTCSGNCSYKERKYYTVGGVEFRNGHAKFQNANYALQSWYEKSPGIQTRIVLLENTYTREGTNFKPNQSVLVREYFKINFSHDITPPSCGVKIYEDKEMTKLSTYTGGWTPGDKFFSMTCKDPETGCKVTGPEQIKKGNDVVTKPKLVPHLQIPRARFINNVDLVENACQPSNFKPVMYDRNGVIVDLKVDGVDQKLNYAENRKELKTGGFVFNKDINFKATNKKDIEISFLDKYIENSISGVSGIKGYDILLEKVSDRSFTPLATPKKIDSCSFSEDFSAKAFNPDGTRKEDDKKIKSFSCTEFTEAGRYELKIKAADFAGNETNVLVYLNVYPVDISVEKSSISVDEQSTKYADNISKYNYKLSLKDRFDNPIFTNNGKVFNYSTLSQDINGVSNGKTIYLDNTKTGGKSALVLEPASGQTNIDGGVQFSVKSYTPGEYDQRFTLRYVDWDNNYIQNGAQKNFTITLDKKNDFLPLYGISIETKEKLQIGKDQKYDITLDKKVSRNVSDGRLYLAPEDFKIEGYKWAKIVIEKSTFEGKNNKEVGLGFVGTLDATTDKNVLSGPKLIIDKVKTSYIIDGNRSVHYLDPNYKGEGCDRTTLGVKILGRLQGDGKMSVTTSAGDNYTDISRGELRAKIRENAYKMIRGMKSGQILNGVKYVEGDYVLDKNPNYETLVVKDGNLHITEDVNPSKKLGVIVLADNYPIQLAKNSAGDVYLTNNVLKMSAYIYADGGLLSGKLDGTSYSDAELSNKLELFGSIFTRNTIGGATAGSGKYLLPGGGETSDFQFAQKYDLNYLRKAMSASCSDGNKVDDYSFLIRYNPQIQTDAPKGFKE